MSTAHQKVSTSHLSRDAYLYVRQSTPRQVIENGESTLRQYALRERAVALGWPTESIVVIDSDQGLSGADRDREGFQRLVAEVGMGQAGIVLGLEVSRLARNSTEWHRLLEICALSETLILDEDGVYDPGDFNDRLLLGLKGTMSEAELHLLRARLRGGILNRAKRGELKMRLPLGLVYDPPDRVVLDPDAQVQHSLRLLFDTFARTGTACATVKHFRDEGLLFPRRPRSGPYKGELHWQPLRLYRVLEVLHNPRYAGAFAFGRHRHRRRPGGGVEVKRLAREEWTVLLPDMHPGYISWERFEANQRQLRDNAQAYGPHRRSAPREGPALIQGLAPLWRLRRPHDRALPHPAGGGRCPTTCASGKASIRRAGYASISPVPVLTGQSGELLVELMTPVTLEMALQVHAELAARAEEVDAWRAQQVQRAREEADLARQRFMQTHPENRMVADVLEAEWNAKLRALDEVQHDLEHHRAEQSHEFGEQQRQRILAAGDRLSALVERSGNAAPRAQADRAITDRGRNPGQGQGSPPGECAFEAEPPASSSSSPRRRHGSVTRPRPRSLPRSTSYSTITLTPRLRRSSMNGDAGPAMVPPFDRCACRQSAATTSSNHATTGYAPGAC